jgi:hypothetical protein
MRNGLPATALTAYDDGQANLSSGGHAELPGGGQRNYLV